MERRRAFTLLELLVVVAIIAILAAIAVPSLMEAQTRSKVAAAKSNLRVGAGALEMYAVDWSRYPPTRRMIPNDPAGLLASDQLTPLTTPVAYLASLSGLADPFGTIQVRSASSHGSRPARDHFPEVQPPNAQRSLLYYHYPTLAAQFAEPRLGVRGAALVSIGPDLADSLGAYRPFSRPVLNSLFPNSGIQAPVDTIYDPTNGTVSEGDIASFVGVANRFNQ